MEPTSTTPSTDRATDAGGPPQDRELRRVADQAVAAQPGATASGAAHPGAATHGDDARGALVAALNGDLRTEYQSILQYVQHVAVLRGPEYLRVVDELRAHLTQELHHALVLAEQIDFLGGRPDAAPPAVAYTDDSTEALGQDLELEERQLERYRARVQQANDAGLPDVAEALRPLLEQTQEHVRDLRSALGR